MLYAHDYIVNPTHRLEVVLIGVGGTGSFVLGELMGLSNTLKMLERKPLKITVIDPDIVEEHNVGRQKFFPADIGLPKAAVLATRINRAYGSDVSYVVDKVDESHLKIANIVITCVDNVVTRRQVNKILSKKSFIDFQTTYYWIDAGNSRDYGQVILSTHYKTKKKELKLPSVIALHPEMNDIPNEPSCSIREALNEQSFMINKLTGVYILEMLASLLLDYNLQQSQVYFSLNPINVKTNKT